MLAVDRPRASSLSGRELRLEGNLEHAVSLMPRHDLDPAQPNHRCYECAHRRNHATRLTTPASLPCTQGTAMTVSRDRAREVRASDYRRTINTNSASHKARSSRHELLIEPDSHAAKRPSAHDAIEQPSSRIEHAQTPFVRKDVRAITSPLRG